VTETSHHIFSYSSQGGSTISVSTADPEALAARSIPENALSDSQTTPPSPQIYLPITSALKRRRFFSNVVLTNAAIGGLETRAGLGQAI